jgi:hypothetical protein
MTVAMKWDDFTHVSPRHIRYVLRRLAPGRKNKDAPTREFTRGIVSTEPEPALHPISLLCDYRDAVRKYADRNRVSRSPLVWQLPTEDVLPSSMNSEKMNLWFTAVFCWSHTK